MEVMIETCCGIDVHQKSIVCCILDGPLESNKPKKIQKKLFFRYQILHFSFWPKAGTMEETNQ